MVHLNKVIALLLSFLICGSEIQAQEIIGVSSRDNNELSSWIIYADSVVNDGILELRNSPRTAGESWRWEVYGQYGDIERLYKPHRIVYELRGEGETITIRPLFPNDFSQWYVTDNSQSLIIQAFYPTGENNIVWQVQDSNLGNFTMLTVYGSDVRDWEVYDELYGVSIPMKVATFFIVLRQYMGR